MPTPTMNQPSPTIDAIRAQFPALSGDTILLENAGGSQVPRCVADAIRDYMLSTYVQLGAGYELSQQCTETVHRAHAFINRFMNGEGIGQVILGASDTQLTTMLAECYERAWKPGDEIILCESGHEANIGPWLRLERAGAVIKWWKVDPATGAHSFDDLEQLLTDQTRLVAMVHVSNLLGEIVDLKRVSELAHAAGARVVADGVALAPHRAIDVKQWGVDWYSYSTYKVFGPHMAALFGTNEAMAELDGPNHFFIPKTDVPYKFELGGASHEGCAGLLALGDYLQFIAGDDRSKPIDRATIDRAWSVMTQLELPLQERLIDFLRSREDVRLIGPAHGKPTRVPTISFTHRNKSSASIAKAINARGIGMRSGHMYAYRLCKAMGINTNDGVVRISMVHYNTLDEIDRLIDVLNDVL